jgi:hypothetical protein
VERNKDMRAMTLMELSDLPGFISDKGKHVLLALGPCGVCKTPKGNILRAILDQDPHLISHLVVDSRTACEVFKSDGNSRLRS